MGSREGDEHRATDGYDASGHRSHEVRSSTVDALWSCTTWRRLRSAMPGRHRNIDHFVDMRRNMVAESDFPVNSTVFKTLNRRANRGA